MKKYKRVKTPTILQMEAVECGAVSLAIILGAYGRYPTLEELRLECGVSRDGSKAGNILDAAKKYGLEGHIEKKSAEDLFEMQGPLILFWQFRHFLVFEGLSKTKVYLNDPATGPRAISYEDFKRNYSEVVLSFEKQEGFQKSGKPSWFLKELYARIREVPGALSFLFFTGLWLMVTGFGLPAFLMIFLESFFSKFINPWQWDFVGAVFFTALFVGALTGVQGYFLNRLGQRLAISFSSRFFWHLLHLPSAFYAQRYSGELTYRMTLNESVAATLTGPLISSFLSLLLIVFYAVALFFYDVLIASIAISGALLNLLCMYYVFQARSIAYGCLMQDFGRSVSESFAALSFIEAIKARGLELSIFQRWAGFYNKTINARQFIGRKDVLLKVIPIFFQFLILAALLSVGSYRILEGSLTTAKLMAMQLLIMGFLRPVNLFMGYSSLMQNMKVELTRLRDVMKNPVDTVYQKRQEKEDAPKDSLSGRFSFEGVSFAYSPRSPEVLKNIHFSLEPGHRIAVVGPSGSGKSTVAKLASGIYYPTQGRILYDGKPLSEISTALFRDYVALVDQDIFLFTGTIRENLTLWNPKVPEEILIQATKDAHIHEEILEKPKGYDYVLIEGGRNLSGGQRQRLEIARALVYNPSFLILDEATSALDAKTEDIVLDNLQKRGCTVLMIAHRLSSIRDADEIIVLEKGEITERGSHEELKNQEGLYQSLLKGESVNE